jgi:hypothetical protein
MHHISLNPAKPGFNWCSWHHVQFSSPVLTSPYLNTARSVLQREIASGALSAKVFTPLDYEVMPDSNRIVSIKVAWLQTRGETPKSPLVSGSICSESMPLALA